MMIGRLTQRASCALRIEARRCKSTAPLTSTQLPNLKRGDYSSLTDADVQHFERLLGAGGVLRDETDIAPYNTDWMSWYRGRSRCVLLPRTVEEVSAVMKHCFDRRLAVVPQSGNTGLVGASVPVFDEIVVSMRRLNKRFDFDPIPGILQCDAGLVLEELDTRLGEFGYMMPLDLGAKGSCLIGGNVATGAGGVRLLRYGSLHAHVLALEVVLPDKDGTVLECGPALRKDNTGFHESHLFIGSEGQLGLITQVAMTAVPKPNSVQVAMLGCDSFLDCCKVLGDAKRLLGEILSSFEMMDSETMRCLKENHGRHNVLSTPAAFNLLIETSGSSQEHDQAKLNKFLESCLEKGLAVDGVLATSVEQANTFWALRENATLALMDDGYVFKHDISLPLKHYYRLTEAVRERVGSLAKRVITYGHVGDGNTHLNVTASEFSQELYDRLYPFVYEWTTQHGGSISAEHGVGLLKKRYMPLGKSPAHLAQYGRLKRFYDPRLILNPYKMLTM
uniref:D-2-hydroxyglutarate dehydrogenase, mitochondrial n=1 Tax=Plectus sambesii TaxID=2011161 RepID=A0A914UKG8_9BILA